MQRSISWQMCLALFFFYGSSVKAGMTEEEAAEVAGNTLSQAAQEIKQTSTATNIIGNQNTVYVPDQSNLVNRVKQIQVDLLTLEQNSKELPKQISDLEKDTPESTTFLILKNCVIEAQRLHAEIAYLAFRAKTDSIPTKNNSILEIALITLRLSETASQISSVSFSEKHTERADDFQRYIHGYKYHMDGIQRATEELASSNVMARQNRPFPIPIPIPQPPYHPPVTPGPSPAQPADDTDSCTDDCSDQYDADCEACGEYVTDPRARALCYSSAASRQGVCIRNCYHK